MTFFTLKVYFSRIHHRNTLQQSNQFATGLRGKHSWLDCSCFISILLYNIGKPGRLLLPWNERLDYTQPSESLTEMFYFVLNFSFRHSNHSSNSSRLQSPYLRGLALISGYWNSFGFRPTPRQKKEGTKNYSSTRAFQYPRVVVVSGNKRPGFSPFPPIVGKSPGKTAVSHFPFPFYVLFSGWKFLSRKIPPGKFISNSLEAFFTSFYRCRLSVAIS